MLMEQLELNQQCDTLQTASTISASYDKIVKKEDKQLSSVDEYYEITFKIEIFRERGHVLLSRLYRYKAKHGISLEDKSNPWVKMSFDLAYLLNNDIYDVKTPEDIERYNIYINCIKKLLAVAEQQEVTV